MSSDATIGVLAALAGSVILNLGVNLQKLSHKRDALLPASQRRVYVKRPLWWLGLLVLGVGNAGDLIALGFVSAVVSVPIGAVSLVSNVFYAKYLLGEASFGTRCLVATGMIVIGATITTVFSAAAGTETRYSYEQLEQRFRERGEYHAFAAITGAIIVVSWLWFRYEEKRLDLASSPRDAERKLCRATSAGRAAATKLSVTAFAALVGAHTMLLARGSAEMMDYSLTHADNQFARPEAVLVVAGLVLSALLQLHYLNVALKYFKSSWVVPVFYPLWATASVLGAGALYGEMATFEALNYVCFFAGLGVVCAGVVVLSRRDVGVVVGEGVPLCEG